MIAAAGDAGDPLADLSFAAEVSHWREPEPAPARLRPNPCSGRRSR